MAGKFPLASHLANEEMDYELMIRNRVPDLKLDTDAKIRLLRNLFHEDVKENLVYGSPYNIDQEYDHICAKVKFLRGKLDKGMDEKCISRLKHYLLRVLRSVATNPPAEKLRHDLAVDIKEVLTKFSTKKGQKERRGSQQGSLLDEATGGTARIEQEDDEIGTVEQDEDELEIPSPTKETGATPKNSRKNKEANDREQELLNRIENLERQLMRACLAWSGVDTTLPDNGNNGNDATFKEQRSEGDRLSQAKGFCNEKRQEKREYDEERLTQDENEEYQQIEKRKK